MKRFIVSFGLAFLVAACSGDNGISIDKPETNDSSSSVAPESSSKAVEPGGGKVVNTSRSEVVESSSSAEALPDTVLVDERDGQTYRIVKIGDQVWMAPNVTLWTKRHPLPTALAFSIVPYA